MNIYLLLSTECNKVFVSFNMKDKMIRICIVPIFRNVDQLSKY